MEPYPHTLSPSHDKLLFALDLPETFSIWVECDSEGNITQACTCGLMHSIRKAKKNPDFNRVSSVITSTVQMDNGMYDLGLKNWWD